MNNDSEAQSVVGQRAEVSQGIDFETLVYLVDRMATNLRQAHIKPTSITLGREHWMTYLKGPPGKDRYLFRSLVHSGLERGEPARLLGILIKPSWEPRDTYLIQVSYEDNYRENRCE